MSIEYNRLEDGVLPDNEMDCWLMLALGCENWHNQIGKNFFNQEFELTSLPWLLDINQKLKNLTLKVISSRKDFGGKLKIRLKLFDSKSHGTFAEFLTEVYLMEGSDWVISQDRPSTDVVKDDEMSLLAFFVGRWLVTKKIEQGTFIDRDLNASISRPKEVKITNYLN